MSEQEWAERAMGYAQKIAADSKVITNLRARVAELQAATDRIPSVYDYAGMERQRDQAKARVAELEGALRRISHGETSGKVCDGALELARDVIATSQGIARAVLAQAPDDAKEVSEQ